MKSCDAIAVAVGKMIQISKKPREKGLKTVVFSKLVICMRSLIP